MATESASSRIWTSQPRIESADLDFPQELIVPACLEPGIGICNAGAIWAGIMAQITDARRALGALRGSFKASPLR